MIQSFKFEFLFFFIARVRNFLLQRLLFFYERIRISSECMGNKCKQKTFPSPSLLFFACGHLHGAVGTAWLRPAWCRLHVFSFEIINKARICMSQFPRYPTSLTIRHHWNVNFLVFFLCMLSYRYFQWKINKLDQSSLNLIPRDFPFWSLPISVYSGFLMKVSICFIFSLD